MSGLKRRKFLKLAGAGSVAATIGGVATATGSLNLARKLGSEDQNSNTITFRAITGMPQEPLPSYASYVIEGHVNLDTQSGTISKSVMAGNPEDMSNIALPGFSQLVRVTKAQQVDGIIQVEGMVDDRSQLQAGEAPEFVMHIDPTSRIVRASFFGSQIKLSLE
ncbi:MAG TPA: twin-arginine translocation signal domain-containing protein [Chloroflexia bacterium]|nr:twin-arginine translocation signal domain-containing protein [Chloroflexia bacterium]